MSEVPVTRAAQLERMPRLKERHSPTGHKRAVGRGLSRVRLRHSVYPQIRETPTPELLNSLGAATLQHLPCALPLSFRLLPYRGMGSGIPRALGEWPQIELISEVSGNQFTARVQRPRGQWAVATDPATEQVEASVEALVEALVEAPVALTDTDQKILIALSAQPLGRSLLLSAIGYSQPTGNYKAAMSKLLQTRLIEPTIPEKPNSRLQQYRLTEQGKALLR